MSNVNVSFIDPYPPRYTQGRVKFNNSWDIEKQNHQTTQKQTADVKSDLNEIQDISSKQIQGNNKRCVVCALLVSGAVLLIIAAGVLPALLIVLIGQSTTTRSTSVTNTAYSTTINSVVSSSASSSSSSTSQSTSIVSTASTSAAGFTAGGAVLSSTTNWYGYEEVTLTCSLDLANITITIYVQKTVNATYNGAFNTFWGGTMNQTYTDTGLQVVYLWTIVSGQTIHASGSPYRAQAQFHLYGLNQTTNTDSYIVTATTVSGITSTITGNF